MKTQIKFPNSSLVSVINGSIVVKDSTGGEHTFTNASVISVNNGTIIIESEWKPKNGELVKFNYLGARYGIFKEIAGDKFWTYGSSFETLSEIPWDYDQSKFRYCRDVLNISPVTPEEQKEFDDFCKSQGKLWNKETLQWEKYKWMPRFGDTYYYIDMGIKGSIGTYTYENDSTDQYNYECGNCFPTKEQAQKAAEKVKELLKSL
jgi:hypothetical protein